MRKVIVFTLSCLLAGCMKEQRTSFDDCPVFLNETDEHVELVTTGEELKECGFEYGDSVDITFSNGFEMKDVPFYSGYFAPIGDAFITSRKGKTVSIEFQEGKGDWNVADAKDGDTVTLTLSEKCKYENIQKCRYLTYSNSRKDYRTDEEFANFRNVTIGNIKPGVLYRGASPFNNSHNRAPYADKLCSENNIKTVFSLLDTDKDIEKYINNSKYFKKLYSNKNVVPIIINTRYRTNNFRKRLTDGLILLSEHEPPFYVHCLEGKDRTGFVCILLEALCGASYDEIRDDFMKTYENYYSITETSEEYEVIIDTVLDPMLKLISDEDIYNCDLSKCAETYLMENGMSSEQIKTLKDKLTN